MIFWIGLIVIFFISLILAVLSVKKEMAVPFEVKSIKIRKSRGLGGVILFLKRKVVHYSADSSGSDLSSSG